MCLSSERWANLEPVFELRQRRFGVRLVRHGGRSFPQVAEALHLRFARGILGDPGVERGALTLGELSGEVPDQHRVDAFREHARRVSSLLKGALKRGETPSLTPQSPLSTYVERGTGGEDG